MFARLAWGKVKSGTWGEYERIYHEEILPATRDVKGLSLRELLQGADDPDEGISLTLWDSREDLDAYERSSLHQELVERARAFYVGEFWVKHFDVRLGEARKQRQPGGVPQEGLGGWQSTAEAGSSEGRAE
jgi:heme-degrading monooxygenase HmoA